jgi:predicted ATPase/class 3 adenylate cyclase
MTQQPSGSVTFLFTDIEGSTQLLRTLGPERYSAVLRTHCDLLREAFAERDGYEVNYEGDSFFVAFTSATEAVAAAKDAQHALMAQTWPAGVDLRVRMGMHTGQPLLAPPKYVGLDVHRAARIAASGHGGQVLVSVATADALPAGTFVLRDLGEHRFKDLAATERVYQVGNGSFPALNSLYRTNLPIPPTSFVGRERELTEIVQLVTREHTRLLTLTGPGGTGKTRLAAQAAAEAAASFPDGVWWVGLASLRDPALVLPAIAQALAVKAEGGEGLADTLKAVIARRQALVILDNAEHLLPQAGEILSSLVQNTEQPVFLVTSREPLRISSEVVRPVPALTPQEGADLFVARAATAGGDLVESPALSELCQRLDCLPLALELAAARTTLLSPEELLDRLAQRLDLLKAARDADPRQQTLRATIAWSYDLLTGNERTLFARLAVFAGGWTLEAAESVCDIELETLASLLDKSLVRRRDDRFGMLETIREFARERFDASFEAEAIQRRHAEWYSGFATRAAQHLYGPDQVSWLQMLEADHDNFRASLVRAFTVGDPELIVDLAAALHPFWYKHGHIEEGRRWLERALEVCGGHSDALRARLSQGASVFAGTQDDWERARELAEDALALYRRLGDSRGVAIILRDLGAAAVRGGDYVAAKRFYEESASGLRELNERRLLATVIANLGDLAFRQGHLVDAAERTQESLAMQRELGATFGVAISLITLGFISVCDARDEDARQALEEAMLLANDLGSTDNLAYAFEGMAAVAAVRKEWERAELLLGRSEALREATATELEVAEQTVHEQTLTALRAARSAEEIREGLASGRQMSDDETIRLALGLRAPAQA